MKCQHCGSELEFVVAENVTRFEKHSHNDDMVIEALLHCDNCGHDWRAILTIPHDMKLLPKFWG